MAEVHADTTLPQTEEISNNVEPAKEDIPPNEITKGAANNKERNTNNKQGKKNPQTPLNADGTVVKRKGWGRDKKTNTKQADNNNNNKLEGREDGDPTPEHLNRRKKGKKPPIYTHDTSAPEKEKVIEEPQTDIKKKRRIAIDYIIDKNYANEYIQGWLGLPFISAIREDPNFHSFLNHNDLKKEITESYAVFVRVQHIIKRLYAHACETNNNNSNNVNSQLSSLTSDAPSSPSPSPSSASLPITSHANETSTPSSDSSPIPSSLAPSPSVLTPSPSIPAPSYHSDATAVPSTPSENPLPSIAKPNLTLEEFTENIVLFDVCSGKGYAATLLTFMFPKLKIFMIDKDTRMNIQHLKRLPNVEMVYFDLFKKEKVKEWVEKQTKNKIGLFLGTHLCGELSEVFVDIYNTVNELRGLVLAPCCLSKRKRIFADTAAKLKIDNYEYWTMHLYWMIQQSKKDICADEHVFSIKNNYISAVKL